MIVPSGVGVLADLRGFHTGTISANRAMLELNLKKALMRLIFFKGKGSDARVDVPCCRIHQNRIMLHL